MIPGIWGVGAAIGALNAEEPEEVTTGLLPIRKSPPVTPRATSGPSVYTLEAANKKLTEKLAAARIYNNKMYAACRALGIEPETINAKIIEMEAS